jgi:hypothetical protein
LELFDASSAQLLETVAPVCPLPRSLATTLFLKLSFSA